MNSTRISVFAKAPEAAIYRAILDPQAVASWMVPDGMRAVVHTFESREGGAFRISLTYDDLTNTGKTTAHTDTYHGRFLTLVPDRRVVQTVEFETEDPSLQGEMIITYELVPSGEGTDIRATHERLPVGLSPELNELGWRSSLAKLVELVESGGGPGARAS